MTHIVNPVKRNDSSFNMVSSDHPVLALIVHKLRCPCYQVMLQCAVPSNYLLCHQATTSFIHNDIKEYLYEMFCTKNKNEVINICHCHTFLPKEGSLALVGSYPSLLLVWHWLSNYTLTHIFDQTMFFLTDVIPKARNCSCRPCLLLVTC